MMANWLDDLAESVAAWLECVRWEGPLAADALRAQWAAMRGRERDDAIGYDDDHNYRLRNMVG